MSDQIPVVDLFAGPGGLGEGFASTGRFRAVLSIERDPIAHSTLTLRECYRGLESTSATRAYYDLLRGEFGLEQFKSRYSAEWERAERVAWCAVLGKVSRDEVRARVATSLGKREEWVLLGGPPCQAYSMVGRSRNRGVEGYRPDTDHRQYLYREYLKVLADHAPAVFVMENVKGLLSAEVGRRNIFERILEDLERPARAVHEGGRVFRDPRYDLVALDPQSDELFGSALARDFIVRAERFGVPQARHRVIVIGVRRDTRLAIPRLQPQPTVSLSSVIDDLPRLRSGRSAGEDSGAAWRSLLCESERAGWFGAMDNGLRPVAARISSVLKHLAIPRAQRGAKFLEGTPNPSYGRSWFVDSSLKGFCSHETRSHIDKDLARYLFASTFAQVNGYSPRLSDYPRMLLPNHRNVAKARSGGMFADRFRVQVADRPATTITSHISKDGHYYIHPDPSQCRSFTLREAARVQTFPDNYLFLGPRTEAFRQVGNAVPPLLAREIALAVLAGLRGLGAR